LQQVDCGLHVPEKSMQANVTGAGKDPQAKKTEKTGHSASRLPYNATAPTFLGMPKNAFFARAHRAFLGSQAIYCLTVATLVGRIREGLAAGRSR
jgi:hypothetical protein